MDQTIILKESDFKHDKLSYSEGYLTNEEYLFKKELLNLEKSSPALVEAVTNTKGFLYNGTTKEYNTHAELPECSKVIPDINDKELFTLKKTQLLLETTRQSVARVFTVTTNNGETFPILINKEYAKMFEGFKLVTTATEMNSRTPVIVLDNNYNVVGLVMPIVNHVFQGVTI